MIAGNPYLRARPGFWVVLALALAIYGGLHFAERYTRPQHEADEPRYPFIGKGPSLDETFVWIRKWALGIDVSYTVRYLPGPPIQVAQGYKQVSHSGCAVTITVVDRTFETPDYDLTFDLADLQGGIHAVKMVYDGAEIWKVPFQTVESRRSIHDRSGATTYTYIATPDRVLARRLARAFDHAVGLCAVKESARKPAAVVDDAATQ